MTGQVDHGGRAACHTIVTRCGYTVLLQNKHYRRKIGSPTAMYKPILHLFPVSLATSCHATLQHITSCDATLQHIIVHQTTSTYSPFTVNVPLADSALPLRQTKNVPTNHPPHTGCHSAPAGCDGKKRQYVVQLSVSCCNFEATL